MANTSLTPELIRLVTELAEAFAQSQKVVAARARIGLFYQNAEATDLFRKVSEYGEELRNKHMAGMPPTEEEMSRFDTLRQNVVDNPLCKGFLESRQTLDDMLGTVNQYLCLAIDKGSAPTDEEVAAALTQQMSACSCGGGCHGEASCDECDGHCQEEGHECKCGGHHGEEHGCCGGHGHDEGHECHCGKHQH